MRLTTSRSPWRASLLILILVSSLLVTASPASSTRTTRSSAPRKQPLSSLRHLNFYAGKRTTARRGSPIPQLSCQSPGKKGLCERAALDVVHCEHLGDGSWKCEADLPRGIKLGRVAVSCEGYDSATDENILVGSCGLKYTLLPTQPGSGWGDDDSSSSDSDSLISSLFWLFFFGVLGFIVYGFLKDCLAGRREGGEGYYRGGPGGGGGGGWGGQGGPGFGGGGGGGGVPPGGPPPPYTKTEPGTASANQQQQQGWRPGFWTGLGLGGAAMGAANAFANRGERERERRYRMGGGGGMGYGAVPTGWGYREEWEQDNLFGRTRGGGFGAGPSRGRSDDTGPSGSHRSTGFGDTTLR